MHPSSKHLSIALIGISLSLGANLAKAVNITILDNNPAPHGFGSGSQPNSGVGKEDNETEPGTINTQAWDMEAFVINGTTLSIVGFNMLTGEGGYKPGDLFIKIGGAQPVFTPTLNGSGTVLNSNYDYSYAVDLSGLSGSTTKAYALSGSSVLDSVVYDAFNSNPWAYDNGKNTTPGVDTGFSYLSGEADGSAALVALGLGGLVGGTHNILTIDLSFLGIVPDGNVWFGYTMECGNDSIKGLAVYSSNIPGVPDNSASILLVGLGLVAMSLVGLKRRKAA